ncbi:hypothetical protein SESBI_04044 [Sesbania bispinosa]|nr:hypothetical protein SESBI_04044 [Sesbania bispinosa]
MEMHSLLTLRQGRRRGNATWEGDGISMLETKKLKEGDSVGFRFLDSHRDIEAHIHRG